MHIKRSIHTLGATATIKLPVTAVLKTSEEPPAHVETAQQFNEGDPVTIQLGYDGQLKDEFIGYVKAKNYKQPLEIECEDEFYQTRQTSVTLSGTNTLEDCFAACGLNVAHAVPLTLKNFVVDNKPASWVLSKLKRTYGLNIFFTLQGEVIAGRAIDLASDVVKYRLRENVVNDDNLKYKLAENNKLEVTAICHLNDGEQLEAKAGESGGAGKTLHFYDVESDAEAEELAKQEHARYSYDGYEGTITTLLQPYAEPLNVASLADPMFSERDGDSLIETSEVTFNTSGARRVLTIGAKV